MSKNGRSALKTAGPGEDSEEDQPVSVLVPVVPVGSDNSTWYEVHDTPEYGARTDFLHNTGCLSVFPSWTM